MGIRLLSRHPVRWLRMRRNIRRGLVPVFHDDDGQPYLVFWQEFPDDPYPERRLPGYCWRSWPPHHTDKCGCEGTGDGAAG